jgi:hypothetical protein
VKIPANQSCGGSQKKDMVKTKHTQDSLECWGMSELIEEVLRLQRIVNSEVPSQEVKDSMKRIVDYMYSDEQKNWQENDEPEGGHIFLDVKTLTGYVGGIR